MNRELWDKILQFDLDSPPGEYSFSLRLANENYWTKNFTEEAIMEYRKFMYLAATSDFMVSPSEIIDIVWHQHLIFTQSYQSFCGLLGKQVQHIPSTHNREEFEKFKQAKERTKKLYLASFGEQPTSIWEYSGMYESLNLKKSRFKIRTFIIAGILAFMVLSIPSYFLLRPVYASIDNPSFLIGFTGLAAVTFIALEYLNSSRLKKITYCSDRDSFIYNLQPLELVYLKTSTLSSVINGTVNELIDKGTIKVNEDNTVELKGDGAAESMEQLQTMDSLSQSGRTLYPALLRQLAAKPVFANTANCMDAFRKYFNKSKKFGKLFYLNFAVLSTLLMLGFVRLITGMVRDMPVSQILFADLVLALVAIGYLNRLTRLVCTHTIPQLYKNEILPARQIEGNWQWSYFLLGPAVLATSFVPLVNYIDKSKNTGDNYVSSCGSSCGSSCSSCGGCGGGD